MPGQRVVIVAEVKIQIAAKECELRDLKEVRAPESVAGFLALFQAVFQAEFYGGVELPGAGQNRSF